MASAGDETYSTGAVSSLYEVTRTKKWWQSKSNN